jgi:metal-sulfur cluster biosynthetic enzyme
MRATILAALEKITDPCSAVHGVPAGLVSMGLVRDLDITEGPAGAHIEVTIALTEVGCLMGGTFATEAQSRLEVLPGVESVAIHLDHSFDWEPEDMSPEYRQRLAERRQRVSVLFPVATVQPQSAPRRETGAKREGT